jgi:hypothetical protein
MYVYNELLDLSKSANLPGTHADFLPPPPSPNKKLDILTWNWINPNYKCNIVITSVILIDWHEISSEFPNQNANKLSRQNDVRQTSVLLYRVFQKIVPEGSWWQGSKQEIVLMNLVPRSLYTGTFFETPCVTIEWRTILSIHKMGLQGLLMGMATSGWRCFE